MLRWVDAGAKRRSSIDLQLIVSAAGTLARPGRRSNSSLSRIGNSTHSQHQLYHFAGVEVFVVDCRTLRHAE
jgi:hypothetical protein